jgi:hypothetical protein
LIPAVSLLKDAGIPDAVMMALVGEGRHNKADCQSYKDKAEWIFIVFSGLRMLYRLN